jgi:hypothetical protein
MKKLGLSVICILMFVVTLLVLSPVKITANQGFYCAWPSCPYGHSAYTHCDYEACTESGENQEVCKYCTP